MLPDRSVLKVRPGAEFTSEMFSDLKLQPDQIIGLWMGQNHVRLPASGDFESGEYVMVFPTCRIVSSNVDFTSSGIQWDQAVKIEQEIKFDRELNDDEDDDPTPNVDNVDYSESSVEDIPSIWTKPPQLRRSGTGRIRFVDGQQLTLGKGSQFQLARISDGSILISSGNQKMSFPFEEVLSIDLPND